MRQLVGGRTERSRSAAPWWDRVILNCRTTQTDSLVTAIWRDTLLEVIVNDNAGANVSSSAFDAVIVDYLGPMAELRGEALVQLSSYKLKFSVNSLRRANDDWAIIYYPLDGPKCSVETTNGSSVLTIDIDVLPVKLNSVCLFELRHC